MSLRNEYSPEDFIDALNIEEDISNGYPPQQLEERDLNDELSSDCTIILDENVVADLLNGVWRENDGEEFGVQSFPALRIIDEFDREKIYADKKILMDMERASYSNKSLVNEEALKAATEYVDSNVSRLAMDEWEEQLNEEEDDLYRLVSGYQESILLTYDGDFSSFERATTPGKFLSYDRHVNEE